jgi:hypothetical protein
VLGEKEEQYQRMLTQLQRKLEPLRQAPHLRHGALQALQDGVLTLQVQL